MSKQRKKIIFTFLLLIFSFFLIGSAKAVSHQPDLTIQHSTGWWEFETKGKDIINSTGANQMVHDHIQGYKTLVYTITIWNAGSDKDKFLLWGSKSNQYWQIIYTDSVGRDITKEITSSGWQTVTLWPGEKEEIKMKISPKKAIRYGQEDKFFVMAKSLSNPVKVDKVLAHVSIRFKEQKTTPSQFAQPQPKTGAPSSAQKQAGRPDLEIKQCKEANYLGKNIFEAKDKIKKQTAQITTNLANGMACFNVKLTNIGSVADIFLFQGPTVIKGNWKINYFAITKTKKIDITSDIIKKSYSVSLEPGKSQIFEIQITPAEEAANKEVEKFYIFAQSKNNTQNLDNALLIVKINVDLDNDGMGDIWEKKYGLDFRNPKDAEKDLDGDGLVNREEYFYRTNPKKKDSNGDGLWDGAGCLRTILYLPGKKDDHLIVAGPIFTAKGEIAKGQTISFNLTGKNVDWKTSYKINDNGLVAFRVPEDNLKNPGKYLLKTMGNEMSFQENAFFIGPWGKVLDKKTKSGIKKVQIDLFSCKEGCCQWIAHDTSQEDGSWGNFMVPPGNYQIRISNPGFKKFVSPVFYLKPDNLEHQIFLSPPVSLWAKIILIIIGIGLMGVLVWALSKLLPKAPLKKKEISLVFQPDGQIKNEKESDYLGDTIYNLTGQGQTKKQTIKSEETAVFHIRIQNDGAHPDKFIIRVGQEKADIAKANLPVAIPQGWQVKFFNTLYGGNDITKDIIGKGWETGMLGPGISKDIRLEARATNQKLARIIPLRLQINITSKGDPSKTDTVKAEVEFIPKTEEKII